MKIRTHEIKDIFTREIPEDAEFLKLEDAFKTFGTEKKLYVHNMFINPKKNRGIIYLGNENKLISLPESYNDELCDYIDQSEEGDTTINDDKFFYTLYTYKNTKYNKILTIHIIRLISYKSYDRYI